MSDISRTETRPEYVELAHALVTKLGERGVLARDRVVIAVAGESGSGKSVTAASLARALDGTGHRAIVLHQDDYFHRPPRANHAAREADITQVGPGEVDLALMTVHVAAFRRGGDGFDKPVVNYAADGFEVAHVDLLGVQALVIEGTYVLSLTDVDVRIFLEATYADTHARRRARGRDIDSPFVERVLAIEHEIVARQSAQADIVVNRHFMIRPTA